MVAAHARMRANNREFGMAIRTLCLAAALALPLASTAGAEEVTSDQLVDGLQGIFGEHAGMRRSHAKGLCVKGSFKPAADVGAWTKSASFSKEVPVLGRFSIGGGNPKASDKTKTGRGLALRFDPDGTATDFVMLTAPIFFAKTPEQTLGFFKARAAGPDGKPDPAKVKAFTEANPDTGKQGAWINARPVPASYADTNYFSVHAFTLTNAEGKSTNVKFKLVPAGGEKGLSDDEVKTKGDTFLTDEIKERLGKGPVSFNLTAMVGKEGDPLDDPTVEWPEAGHEFVTLGAVEIAGLEVDATCDAGTFDPSSLAEGIAPAPGDQIFPLRSGAYAVSFGRRQQ
jgi:catalase